MVTETLDRISLIFEFSNDSRFVYPHVKGSATNSQLFDFGVAYNSLQANRAHTFFKEERFILEQAN